MIELVVGFVIAAVLLIAEYLLCTKFKSPLWGGRRFYFNPFTDKSAKMSVRHSMARAAMRRMRSGVM